MYQRFGLFVVGAWRATPAFALAASAAPFGRLKFSGMRREGGVDGIRDYLNIKLAQVAF